MLNYRNRLCKLRTQYTLTNLFLQICSSLNDHFLKILSVSFSRFVLCLTPCLSSQLNNFYFPKHLHFCFEAAETITGLHRIINISVWSPELKENISTIKE